MRFRQRPFVISPVIFCARNGVRRYWIYRCGVCRMYADVFVSSVSKRNGARRPPDGKEGRRTLLRAVGRWRCVRRERARRAPSRKRSERKEVTFFFIPSCVLNCDVAVAWEEDYERNKKKRERRNKIKWGVGFTRAFPPLLRFSWAGRPPVSPVPPPLLLVPARTARWELAVTVPRGGSFLGGERGAWDRCLFLGSRAVGRSGQWQRIKHGRRARTDLAQPCEYRRRAPGPGRVRPLRDRRYSLQFSLSLCTFVVALRVRLSLIHHFTAAQHLCCTRLEFIVSSTLFFYTLILFNSPVRVSILNIIHVTRLTSFYTVVINFGPQSCDIMQHYYFLDRFFFLFVRSCKLLTLIFFFYLLLRNSRLRTTHRVWLYALTGYYNTYVYCNNLWIPKRVTRFIHAVL